MIRISSPLNSRIKGNPRKTSGIVQGSNQGPAAYEPLVCTAALVLGSCAKQFCYLMLASRFNVSNLFLAATSYIRTGISKFP